MTRRRGFTIAETMVVAMILGLMLAAVAAAIGPLFSAPDRAQAKTDSLGPMSGDLYLVERDVREGDAVATFACDGKPPVCGDGDGILDDDAVVVPTAVSSGAEDAQVVTSRLDGSPQWSGFIVYRHAGPGDEIGRVYVDEPALEAEMGASPPDRGRLQLLADDAVMTSEVLVPDLTIRGIAVLSASVDEPTGVVSLHMVSRGVVDSHVNSTTFDDAILARN